MVLAHLDLYLQASIIPHTMHVDANKGLHIQCIWMQIRDLFSSTYFDFIYSDLNLSEFILNLLSTYYKQIYKLIVE